jgi:hypothetical protein
VTSWGKVLHDEDLAQAIIDRVLERGRLLALDGPSFRTKHLKLDGALPEASDQVIRISGIDRSEFPEPTVLSLLGQPVAGVVCSVRCVRTRLCQPVLFQQRWFWRVLLIL